MINSILCEASKNHQQIKKQLQDTDRNPPWKQKKQTQASTQNLWCTCRWSVESVYGQKIIDKVLPMLWQNWEDVQVLRERNHASLMQTWIGSKSWHCSSRSPVSASSRWQNLGHNANQKTCPRTTTRTSAYFLHSKWGPISDHKMRTILYHTIPKH